MQDDLQQPDSKRRQCPKILGWQGQPIPLFFDTQDECIQAFHELHIASYFEVEVVFRARKRQRIDYIQQKRRNAGLYQR